MSSSSVRCSGAGRKIVREGDERGGAREEGASLEIGDEGLPKRSVSVCECECV